MNRVRTRTGLLDAAIGLCPSRACGRAIQGGKVRVLGGFSETLPGGPPGWVCEITSVHGRIWLLAIIVDEIRHALSARMLDRVPWKFWIGRLDRKGWNPYDGDAPREADRERRKAVLLGNVNRGGPSDDRLGRCDEVLDWRIP